MGRDVVLLASLATLVLLPGLVWGPYDDAAIFGVLGEGILRGAMPYRDLWDHKPPGVYMVAAAAALMPGPSWPWLWAASVVALTWTGLIIRRMAGLLVAATTVISMGLWPLTLGGGQTESFAAVPAAAAFYFAIRKRWFLAGILSGAAILFSFQLLALLPALIVFAGFRLVPMAQGAIGLSIVVLVATFALIATGTASSAFDVLWTYNRVYLSSDRAGDLRHLWELILPLLPLLCLLPFRGSRWSRTDTAAAVWLGTAALLISFQGRLFPHYVIPLAIPLAILAAPGADRPFARVTAIAASGTLLAIGFGTAALAYKTEHRGPATEEVARWIETNANPDIRILDWGVDANIYLSTGLRPAGRYPYLLPLVTPNYASAPMVEDWLRSLERDPPDLIIDSEAANPHWPEGQDFLRPPPPGAAGGRTADLVGPFRQWVLMNYQYVAEVHGRKIYLLKPQEN
jgi:hypothetical protein